MPPVPPFPPLSLSVSIVCKNNDATIGRTLESVRGLASEIVAVDSGSTDGTIALLEQYGARIIRSPWLGHVKTKQLALEACQQPWILCIDSDESVEPDLAQSIRGAVERNDPALGALQLNRKVYYMGRPLNHAWQPEWRTRLVRRARAHWTGLDPHDSLELIGGAVGNPVPAIASLRGTLRHDSIATFADFLAKQASHSRTMAQSLHNSGVRGSYLRLLLSPPGAVFKQLILKRAFLDGWPGWLAAACTGAGALMKHAMLIELSRSGSSTTDGGATGRP